MVMLYIGFMICCFYIKKLDIVLTRYGTKAVVAEVSSDGQVKLVLPQGSRQKVAWYKQYELRYICNLKEKL
jgi:hypothetical protein